MVLQDYMLARDISKYRLAKMTNIPYMTINDLCNGKSSIEKCSVMTIYQIARALQIHKAGAGPVFPGSVQGI